MAVIGPAGSLWQYSVICFLRSRDQVRVNWIVFPHARITSKGTLLVSLTEYKSFRAAVNDSPAMRAGVPSDSSIPGDPEKDLDLDWRYGVLLADWSTGEEQVWYSAGDASHKQLKPLYEQFNDLLRRGTRTYGNFGGLSLEEILDEDEP